MARVLAPDDAGYASETSGFDLGIACLPDIVVAARTPADVAATVAVASERGERLTILGSGHGRLHEVHGGVAISMRALADVEVDTGKRSARIGAGATWEPVLAATAPRGLAPLCGSAPAVGVAGYLLGGGLGPLARACGFSADHIQAVEVVTPADGSLTVTAESYPDLFWALRGGKGGLGVLTAVTIGLLPLTEVYGGGPIELINFIGRANDADAVLRSWSPDQNDRLDTIRSRHDPVGILPFGRHGT